MGAIVYDSPIGECFICFDGEYVTGMYFQNERITELYKNNPHSKEAEEFCIKELDDYFAGKVKSFTMKVNLKGTDFQKETWNALSKIPYGETRSYKDIATQIGRPKATRAVGGANNKNPVSIIVPCHRVIGADGSLTGYGGELWRKEWLLAHEKKHMHEKN